MNVIKYRVLLLSGWPLTADEINEKNENEPFIYTNGWLAQYADYLRKLLETK